MTVRYELRRCMHVWRNVGLSGAVKQLSNSVTLHVLLPESAELVKIDGVLAEILWGIQTQKLNFSFQTKPVWEVLEPAHLSPTFHTWLVLPSPKLNWSLTGARNPGLPDLHLTPVSHDVGLAWMYNLCERCRLFLSTGSSCKLKQTSICISVVSMCLDESSIRCK